MRFEKKYFWVFPCIAALIFSGCGKGDNNIPDIERNLENDVVITENNKKYEAHVSYIPEGIVSVSFNSPESLANTSFEYKNGKYVVSNNELSGEYNLNPLEKNSVFSKIMGVFNAMGDTANLKIDSQDNDILVFKTNFENSEYIITTDKGGKILLIENPTENFKVEFLR